MTDEPARPAAPRPLPLIGSPWFWLLFIGALFSIPFIKGVGAEYPDPLPGWDSEPLEFTLPDETGAAVSLADLRGNLIVISELPLASGNETERTFDDLRRLRKRLRGLGGELVYVVLCHGGDAAELAAVLDARTARKPVNVFLLDAERETLPWVQGRAGSASARLVLLDRHGRVRGVYGDLPDDVDRLVQHAGQLANWLGSDPEPGQPVTR